MAGGSCPVDPHHCGLPELKELAAQRRLDKVLGSYVLYTTQGPAGQLNVGSPAEAGIGRVIRKPTAIEPIDDTLDKINLIPAYLLDS